MVCSSVETSGPPRFHISDRVEVSKAAWPGVVLTFMCSVWPNEMEVERVFPIRRGGLALVHQYMRGQFR
jgi:complement component 1 Q subcomponent-binding protein, mitochondrial